MPQGLEDIKATLARITRGDTVMDLLLEMERTLDATELFSYKHWTLGELVDGPHIGRYWLTTSWMFPYKLMPDPAGALRLGKIGCKVVYNKDTLLQPRRVLTPKDWANQKTKAAKIEELPIWVVTIDMPMRYINDGLDAMDDYIDEIIKSDTDMIAQEIAPEPEEEMDPSMDAELGGDFEDDGELI